MRHERDIFKDLTRYYIIPFIVGVILLLSFTGVPLYDNPKVVANQYDKHTITIDGEAVIVGKDEPTFTPEITMYCWGDESWLKLYEPTVNNEPLSQKDANSIVDGDYIYWGSKDLDFAFYPFEYNNDGAFEYEIVLANSKAGTDTLLFDITFPYNSENLTFWYQPPLTEEYSTGWSDLYQTYITVNATHVVQQGTGIVYLHRPLDVVGSYAVYHSSKRNNEYMTGKAFHIYRPKLTDDNGDIAWANLIINSENITIDFSGISSWLNKAKYPVTIDPTFGNTAIGATADTGSSDFVYGCNATLTENGTAVSIHYYLLSSADDDGPRMLGLYTIGGVLIGETTEHSGETPDAWISYDMTSTVAVSNGNSYIPVHYGAEYSSKYDAAPANSGRYYATTYTGSFPTPISFTTISRYYSVYCTYTTGVSAPTVVTNDPPLAIWTTSANVSGNVTATGGEDVNWHGFYYDTDGAPYANSQGTSSNISTGMFTENITGLQPGTAYHYMASGNNTAGSGNGTDVAFITLPLGPSDITVNHTASTSISFDWTAIASADNYTIRYQAGAAPVTDNTSGTSGYYGTSNAANVTGLVASTQYTFSLFTLADDEGLQSCSANFSYVTATTAAGIVAPTVVTNDPPLAIWTTSANVSGNVTATGGEDVNWHGFYYDTDGAPYANSQGTSSNISTGMFTENITGLQPGTAYHYMASGNNTAGSGNGTDVAFITLPVGPTDLSVNITSYYSISFDWTAIASADNYTIRWQAGAAPVTDNTSGTSGYYGTANAANVTGLSPNTQYTFSLFTLADDEGLQACSANYAYVTVTTLIGIPSVTMNAATGITYNSAQLNATITDDGGSTCNGTWYWDTTDHGQTTAWSFNATFTGQSAGAINHIISSLSSSTLYYANIVINNETGNDWGTSINFTTSSAPAPGAGAAQPPETVEVITDLEYELGRLIMASFVIFLAFWRRDIFFYLMASPVAITFGLMWRSDNDTSLGLITSIILTGIGIYCIIMGIYNLVRR